MNLLPGRETGGARQRLRWCFFLLLLALPYGMDAQTPPLNETSSSSAIESTLNRLRASSLQLEKLLSQRKLKREQAERLVNELLQELASVRTSLEESLEHSARSEAEIQRLTLSLELSEQTSRSLQISFDEYVTSSDAAIRSARIQGAAVGAGIVAAIWAAIEILRTIF